MIRIAAIGTTWITEALSPEKVLEKMRDMVGLEFESKEIGCFLTNFS